MAKPVTVGAVVYAPQVVTIWDIIKDFFEANGCPMDYVFYSNYETQVRALLDGDIDVAWNSPLAWIEAQEWSNGLCRAIAMRDTDRDRVSHLVVRADGGVSSVADLAGKTVAFGAKDSPQATLIPLGVLRREGLEPGKDFTVRRFDLMVGKHGDHVGGEEEALNALRNGEADACAMLDLNWQRWSTDGTADPATFRVLATTDPFDHCVFTVRRDFEPERESEWLDTLFKMSYDNPDHREMMDLEGLKQWLPGRTSGFTQLAAAVRAEGFLA
jgi:ABC-type phosphate/phosphonate transport system substrate-binding protein